jgi:glycosyltransferase involved in cell wall biosynthesis
MKFIFSHPGIYDYAKKNHNAIGGSERQQWLLIQALQHDCRDVAVINVSKNNRSSESIDGVRFVWMPGISPLPVWNKFTAQEKADWWYCRGADFYLGFIVTIAHRRNTKVAFACAYDDDCKPARALTHHPSLWPFYALGLYLSDKVIIQHEYQYDLLPKILRPKVSWVPSITDMNEFVLGKDRDDYVAWVGVLREHKRPHLLVEIAKKLSDTHFIVCGPPSLHRTSQAYYKEICELFQKQPNIEYRGQVSPAEAQEVISHASVFLSTAEKEGFPNTFLQAWGAGVPVVSLQLDPGGVIKQHSIGVVSLNLDELCDQLNLLTIDTKKNYLIGTNGFEYVNKYHSEKYVIEKFIHSLYS